VEKPNIFILSGPVHSGKSTRLNEWIEERNDVAGILAPIIRGLRNLQDITSGEKRCLEKSGKSNDSEDDLAIGNYIFSSSVFHWGKQVLKKSADEKINWLVIDEIGILELQGRGLEPAVSSLINLKWDRAPQNILLVVRERLVEKVIKHYRINERVQKFDFPVE